MEHLFPKGCDLEFRLQKILCKFKPGDVFVVEFPEDVKVAKYFLLKLDIKYKDIPVIFNRIFRVGDLVTCNHIPGVFDISKIEDDNAIIQPSYYGEGMISSEPVSRKVLLTDLKHYTRITKGLSREHKICY